MKIYIDSANLEDIEKIVDILPVAGVTTNPSILSKEDRKPWETLKAIRKIIGSDMDLHAQVISHKCEDMVEEAKYMYEMMGENSFVKVPVSMAGLKAIKVLKEEKIPTTATAIFTPIQGLTAAMAGASFLAPYVNRLDMVCSDGVKVAANINKLMNLHQLSSQVVAASFKNIQQVLDVLLEGVPVVTLPPALLYELNTHPLTEKAVKDFTTDFETLAGENNTMLYK